MNVDIHIQKYKQKSDYMPMHNTGEVDKVIEYMYCSL